MAIASPPHRLNFHPLRESQCAIGLRIGFHTFRYWTKLQIMRPSEAQVDALAAHLVRGLIARGAIKPKADEKDLLACVVEMMSANFEEEARIDDEADRQAESLARQNPGVDAIRLRDGIRKRLAEKKGFTL